MRAGAIISVAVFVLATCLLRSSEAVTCTVDPNVAGCVDCTQAANAADAGCVAEALAINPPAHIGANLPFPGIKSRIRC